MIQGFLFLLKLLGLLQQQMPTIYLETGAMETAEYTGPGLSN
jgi:hypothetical protein